MEKFNLKYLFGILTICAIVAWCIHIGLPSILGTFLLGYIRKTKNNRTLASGLVKNIIDSLHNYL